MMMMMKTTTMKMKMIVTLLLTMMMMMMIIIIICNSSVTMSSSSIDNIISIIINLLNIAQLDTNSMSTALCNSHSVYNCIISTYVWTYTDIIYSYTYTDLQKYAYHNAETHTNKPTHIFP